MWTLEGRVLCLCSCLHEQDATEVVCLQHFSLAPFDTWALSHLHLCLNQCCPTRTSPHVTSMHACMQPRYSNLTKFGPQLTGWGRFQQSRVNLLFWLSRVSAKFTSLASLPVMVAVTVLAAAWDKDFAFAFIACLAFNATVAHLPHQLFPVLSWTRIRCVFCHPKSINLAFSIQPEDRFS